MDGRPNWRNKAAFSNFSPGAVWAEPYSSVHDIMILANKQYK